MKEHEKKVKFLQAMYTFSEQKNEKYLKQVNFLKKYLSDS